MNLILTWLAIARQKISFRLMGKLLAIAFCSTIFFLGALPAQAAVKISPRLEEQILQVIRQHPDTILESVQAYQQQQQQQLQRTQQSFLQQLKANPAKVIGSSPTLGAEDAKILLVEFSDFECPYCSEARKTVQEFIEKHGKEVKLVYKHFPLVAIHNQAFPAAKAAWAAQQQGKFWEYHDALFTNQGKLSEEFYLQTATKLNLDVEKFKSDRLVAEAAITQDMVLATQLGLSGTPFFVMNGETFSGAIPLVELEKVLERVS
jgi:protein-disulfide isomerase